MQCVRDIFPDAEVSANCVDKYPVKVIVEAKIGGSKVKIWTGKQQDLFRKYGAKRSATIELIKQNLSELKEDLE
eukprot:CAMPEP_0194074226 /NCGR_PEP_ID=MMETSP0149-20130528/1404_1 /TAXON_ID=122233 /ORGANISM="Chaetoceros debilis, Strain MM31A-1" /LENGTH=73 /DNA_ID=CAMNT_0038754363 /DNA_START=147 /DNA_END=368 /DNA_ORIENTATION=+